MIHVRQKRLGLVRRLVAALAVLATALSLTTVASSTAQATSALDFNPENIISDELFYDGYAMSATEVQSFLNQRVPRCTIGDSGRAAGSPWGSTSIASKCLRDFSMATTTKPANANCAAYLGRSSETAAEIITKVAQACGISQRVLLITLEKEQSLLSDTWPTVLQYERATGYMCPDSGPNNSANCDATYAGFFNQVYLAAWQFKNYRLYWNTFTYKPFQQNTIQYSPNPACGSSQVYIQNWATAALYIYTPYRPNQAALNAGWATGDACSSYGNRNFYLMYSTWFGDPNGSGGNSPRGEVKELWTVSNGIRLWGWAYDPDDVSASVQIHVRFGSAWAATNADQPNSAPEALYPGVGQNHGFGMWIAAPVGAQQVCVWARNIGSGVDRLLTCQDVVVPSGSPIGEMKEMWGEPGEVKMWGWALDPDTIDPIDLHVRINGAWAVVRADKDNTAVGATYPAHGPNHGFAAHIPAQPGPNEVCVWAKNVGAGGDTQLACRRVLVPDGTPSGEAKEVWAVPGGIRAWGWAADPESSEPIDLHVRIDGTQWHVIRADAPYEAMPSLLPGVGINHGFGMWLTATPGQHEVCIWAKNIGAGNDLRLTCQNVTVPSGDPRGEMKELWGIPGAIRMWGWAADPETSGPVDLHVRVDGTQWFVITANSPYSAMPQLLPGVGNDHGFGAWLEAAPGSHEVCTWIKNVGSGSDKHLGCKIVVT